MKRVYQISCMLLFFSVCAFAQPPAEFSNRNQGQALTQYTMTARVTVDGNDAVGAPPSPPANFDETTVDWIGAFDPNFITAGSGRLVDGGTNGSFMQSTGVSQNEAGTGVDEGADCPNPPATGPCEEIYLVLWRASDQLYYIYPQAPASMDASQAITFPFVDANNDERLDNLQSGTTLDFNTTNNFVFSAALPVVWMSFSARSNERGDIELQWVTAAERNNDYFTVERSSDGVRFEALAELNGAGNSEMPRQYAYTDRSVPTGKLYYRLRQTDFDGKHDFSPIRSVEGPPQDELHLAPNPTAGAPTLYLPAVLQDTELTVALYDQLGRPVSSPLQIVAADRLVLDQVESLPAGYYQVQVHTAQRDYWQRFIRQ